MYCPVNENETRGCTLISRCCRLYDIALAFLAVLILFTVGIIIGSLFGIFLFRLIPLLVAVAIILFVIFLVTLLTRGCCQNKNHCD